MFDRLAGTLRARISRDKLSRCQNKFSSLVTCEGSKEKTHIHIAANEVKRYITPRGNFPFTVTYSYSKSFITMSERLLHSQVLQLYVASV